MSDENQEMSLKIPAYLRGELSLSDANEIESLAESDPSFAAEIEFQRSVSNALKSEPSDFTPGDMGWARLSKDMNAPERNLRDIDNQKASPSNFWKYAAACFAVAAVGQAGVLANLAVKGKNDDARYLPVSQAVNTSHISTVGTVNTARHDNFTQLLIETKGQIIKGPSALGLYQVKFETRSECRAAVLIFETRTNIIETASLCE